MTIETTHNQEVQSRDIMQALVFSEEEGLRLKKDHPKPVPSDSEALIKVRRAGKQHHQLCMRHDGL